MRTALNLSVDAHRTRVSHGEEVVLEEVVLVDGAPGAEAVVLGRERVARLSVCLGRLNQKTRDIFWAHKSDGMTYQEIADRHGLSVSTVEKHVAKAPAQAPYGIEAQHPDLFIDNLFDLDQAAVVAAAQRQRAQLKNPPLDVDHYLDVLLRQGLVQTTKALATYMGSDEPPALPQFPWMNMPKSQRNATVWIQESNWLQRAGKSFSLKVTITLALQRIAAASTWRSSASGSVRPAMSDSWPVTRPSGMARSMRSEVRSSWTLVRSGRLISRLRFHSS